VLSDALGGQTGVFTLTQADNAQLPLVDSSTITVIAGNAAPTITLALTQNGAPLATITADNADVIHYIDATAGTVTVTATIDDINSDDTHAISWDGSSEVLAAQGLRFDFSPEQLAGNLNLSPTATEENTDDLFATLLTTQIKVISTALPELPTDVDSDGDGIFDSAEGYKDSDGDGIVDYLDNNPDTTELPPLAGELKTVSGLSLSLGNVSTTAQGISANSAIISQADLDSTAADGDEDISDTGYFPLARASLINFKVSGLVAGDAAAVVYPLADSVVITENIEYRKYTPAAGWQEFEKQGDNAISSAIKDEAGNCPAPNSESYLDGLTAVDNCIQLTIVDGGMYDADATENGSIEDPGVLAEANSAPVWTTNPVQLGTHNVNENSSVTITEDLAALASDADGDALTFAKVSGPVLCKTAIPLCLLIPYSCYKVCFYLCNPFYFF